MSEKVEETMDEPQFWFSKGKGIRKAFFVLKTITEKAEQKQKD